MKTKLFHIVNFIVLGLVLNLQGRAQCGGIDFVSSISTGCVPAMAKFTASGFPSGSTFSWDFGSGYTPTSAQDSIKYNLFNNQGVYSIGLAVTLPGGMVCNVNKGNMITIGLQPVVSFAASRNKLCEGPDTVTFWDNTARSMSREWIIDGMIYSNGPKVLTHAFTTPGYKSVTLRVRDSLGCFGLVQLDSFIYVTNPANVDFAATQVTGCSPLSTQFSPNISNLNGNTVVWYDWTLPGSSVPVTTGPNPSVTYSVPGSYDVTLKITTSAGCTYTLTKNNFIKVGYTVSPNFVADRVKICKGEVIRFINTTASTPAGSQISWNLPGGSIVSSSPANDTVFVKYVASGQFDVELVYDVNGCISKHLKPLYIDVQYPLADFKSDDRIHCTVPDTVRFNNTSILPPTGTASYQWTFFDTDGISVLGTSTATNPTFIYTSYGKYNVRLIVNHTNGCSDTITKFDFVTVTKPQADFIAFPTTACRLQPVTFNDITPIYSTRVNPKYLWIFYDTAGNVMKTDTASAPVVYYPGPGNYATKFVTYNAFGCADTLYRQFSILIAVPKAKFNLSASLICAGETITFGEATTPVIPTMVHKWTIQHLDSTNIVITGQGSTFTATFPIPGKYKVSYKSENGTFCSDSTSRSDILVSGLKADFTTANQQGCSPFLANFTSNIVYNLHYQNPSNSVSYLWSVSPSSGVVINNPSSSATDITFPNDGCYDVSLTVTNSEGCSFTETKVNYICVGVKSYFLMPNLGCKGDTIYVTNGSNYGTIRTANAFKWSASSPNVFFYPSDTSFQPKLIFNDTGLITVTLTSYSPYSCFAVTSLDININKPVADFTSFDTINICGPVLVNLYSRSIGADTLIWDFGDGSAKVVSIDTTVAHFYKISNGKNEFDVTLIARNKYGCSDTIVKKSFIKIVGPVPYFTMTNNKGCEPLRVQFHDSSRNVYKFYFSPGQGVIDSVSISDRTYTLSNPNQQYSVYKPYLLVYDNTGMCFQFYQPTDSIVVFRNPDAYFYADNTMGCAPFTVNFIDTSKGAVRWKWDFNNDGITDDTTNTPSYTYTPGIYSVKLIVSNIFGCTDTLLLNDYITSNGKPVAGMTLSDTVICPRSFVTFSDASTAPNPVVKWKWDFGDPSTLGDTSVLRFPQPVQYNNPGVYTVTLYVEDMMGCKDTLVLPNKIRVLDTVPPPSPQIYFVTVENNNEVRVVWNTNPAPSFKSYSLFRDDGLGYLLNTTRNNRFDTNYVDTNSLNVKTQPYWYYLRANDKCDQPSRPGTEHATIWLNATTVSQNTNLITWTPYKGWVTVQNYKLMRQIGNSPFTQIAMLNGTDTFYYDTKLCDTNYTYYVEAIHSNNVFRSRSNLDNNQPPFVYPVYPLQIKRTTVFNDAKVLTEWDNTGVINLKRFLVYKRNQSGAFQFYGSSLDGSFLDNNVDVMSSNYTYYIALEDYCGNVSPQSNFGQSILLNAQVIDEKVHLNWNNYYQWYNGVKNYLLQIWDSRNKRYIDVALLPSTDTSYIDSKYYAQIDSSYKYRVLAIEDIDNPPDTSVSNTVVINLPPKIFVPNAFSPNMDGVNDVFLPVATFMVNNSGNKNLDYQMRIYNRWGQMLFETNDLSIGWDGTYEGQPAQQDVYIYELRCTGFDRHRYNLNGNVTLLR